MSDKLLLTGATGFLGTRLCSYLIESTDVTIYALVRAESEEHALHRLAALWWGHPELTEELGKRIIPVTGDVTVPDLGMRHDRCDELVFTIDYLIHSAAEVAITASQAHLENVNVEGTKHALDFAARINKHHGLKRFSQVSTAYVAGRRQGIIAEDELIDEGFGSLYEQTKFEAEQAVQSYASQFPVSIFRPGQIVGDSKTGEISTFNTLYYPLKLYVKNKLKVLPVSSRQKINLVPVDYVAYAIGKLTFNEEAAGKTFHLTTPYDQQPTARELLDSVRDWAEENLSIKLARPLFISAPYLASKGMKRNMRSEDTSAQKSIATNMLALAPYFSEKREFDTTHARQLLGEFCYDWKDYLDPLLRYCTAKGFLNHSERTVFQQMQKRLRGSRNTLTFYDVSSQGLQRLSASDMNAMIEAAAQALKKRGIGRGSRVAIAGINGTRYLVCDAAIGLVHATSVPLYFTSPAEDIEELVKRSSSELVFLGSQKLIDAFSEKPLPIPMISFADDKEMPEGFISWEEFLQQGKTSDSEQSTGVSAYSDIATIRYTSGTTGEPKGVMFNQAQLVWMAETLPSLLDWETRNAPIRYLSFLPMSHVVEGILVSYAPYYILSDVEIYYLNEFDYLTEALPKVRPHIFFSVPRFYEKVWQQFMSMGIGRYYLSLKEGPLKSLLRPVLRSALLKKAGLDECRQLIVGSAPVSIELLSNFRELGIEIHNAYGLTEAPLITLSRLSKNELGSVGHLLPETQALIGDDGEIMIAGPQVTVGYEGIEEPFLTEEGYFKTGDFGTFSKAGHLIIEGRKKELLVTSYGKNINPQKIETRLKNISSVSEALVIGENKPYCTALLWIEPTEDNAFDTSALDAEVAAINQSLSHPEQLKRWIAIARDLTISAKELTPNLKIRRDKIQQNYQEIVELLYSSEEENPPEPFILHRGIYREH